MQNQHPPVPGMELLVPVFASVLGLVVGVAVGRHAGRRDLDRPWLWALIVGAGFLTGPVLLRPVLRPVYGHLFVPGNTEGVALGFAVAPVEALVTYLVGGSAFGVVLLLLYLWYSSLVLARQLSAADISPA